MGEESLLAAVAAATEVTPGDKSKGKKKKKKGKRVEWPPASAEQLAAAGKVVRAVARGEAGWPFEAPVTDAMAPGYSREIARPMDLGTIAKALKRGNYTSLGEPCTQLVVCGMVCRICDATAVELQISCTGLPIKQISG